MNPSPFHCDKACFLNERGACEFFASKLAPTTGIGAIPQRPSCGNSYGKGAVYTGGQALSPLNLHRGKRRLVTRLLQYIPGFLRGQGLPLWP
ncbi:hypothetical protein PflCFBP13510_10190 [Pseudomonas fluorescens]|nr:hypothetical protein PflCFBP13510_10190 [Pseudomonas fluorescens]